MKLIRYCSLYFIVALQLQAFGQSDKIEVSREYNEQSKIYNLVADNPFPERKAIEVTFTNSDNMSSSAGNLFFVKTIRQGKNILSRIKRTLPDKGVSFSYRFQYIEGCKDSKPDFDYPYLIPLKLGSKTKVNQMYNLKERYGDSSPPKDWYAITLSASERDTVFASRRGIVTEVEYGRKGQNAKGTSYSSNRNWMSVQHKDCTTAKYELFADDEIWVEAGDRVEVGQPLGVISAENYTSGSHLRFSVLYYNPHPKLIGGEDVGERHLRAYVPVKFYTKDGIIKLQDHIAYEVALSPEMITKDMSKKELKKWKKNN